MFRKKRPPTKPGFKIMRFDARGNQSYSQLYSIWVLGQTNYHLEGIEVVGGPMIKYNVNDIDANFGWSRFVEYFKDLPFIDIWVPEDYKLDD